MGPFQLLRSAPGGCAKHKEEGGQNHSDELWAASHSTWILKR